MKKKDGFRGERSIVLPQAVVSIIENDPVASSLYITDIGYYPKAQYHYRKRDMAIKEYVFIYCVEGSGWYRVNGKEYNVKQDQYFILPAGVAHEYGASEDNPWTIYWIHFGGPMAAFYATDCITPLDVTPAVSSRINTRNTLFEDIFHTLNKSYAIESLRYAMVSFQHYLATLRYIQQYRSAINNTDTNNLLQMAIHYFEENIERRIQLDSVCKFVGLSASRLSALFKEKIGYSPLNYFMLLKIKKACHLLDNTDMKITQISLYLGFDDPYYFSRLFTKMMGISPKYYRSRTRPTILLE